MRVDLPFTEALAFATSRAPLPDLVRSLTCTGSTIRAEIDLRAIPTTSSARRLAFAAAGTVTVTARFDEYSGGVASVVVTAHARGLPAHKLLPQLIEPINSAVVRAGLPDGTITVERGDPDPVVQIDVQHAVESRVHGMTVTALSLTDAVIRLEADIAEFRVLGRGGRES